MAISRSWAALLLAAASLTAGCRKERVSDPSGPRADSGATRQSPPELQANHLEGSPQAFLWGRASSPVHWQRWSPQALELARKSSRPVFVFAGAPQYPGCFEILDVIDHDPGLIKAINENFVPVLVTTDSCRETALLANRLQSDLRQSVGFPFLLFLSPEGAEVSWRAVSYTPGSDFRESLLSNLDTVSRMWRDSEEYVLLNSRTDHTNRVNRMSASDPSIENAEDRKKYVRDATRHMAALYDDDIKTMAGSGGLFPVGMMQCLAAASSNPDTPADTAAMCQKALRSFAPVVLHSAMVDPLDGGIYTARAGSWEIPMSNRICMTQARAIRALVSLHSALGDELSFATALGAAKYAEAAFMTRDGLFSFDRLPSATPMETWLWTTEQVEQALTPQEAELWKAISHIRTLGNIPGEADPQRVFFRLNSLGLKEPLETAAKKAGVSPAEAAALLESGRKKLLKAREDRNPTRAPDATPSAAPSFRMISAYAALYTATGDESWRTKALTLAAKCRETFSRGPLLMEQATPDEDSVSDARAFTYMLAIQAALDLAEVTLDDSWRVWAGDLVTTAGERFADSHGRFLEAPPDSSPSTLPIEDRAMCFDDSTAGLLRMNLARLKALGQEPPPALAAWLTSEPDLQDDLVIYTDSLLAASFSLSRVIVDLPANASPEWKKAASTLPLDRIARRMGSGSSTKLRFTNGASKEVASPDQLLKAAASLSGS